MLSFYFTTFQTIQPQSQYTYTFQQNSACVAFISNFILHMPNTFTSWNHESIPKFLFAFELKLVLQNWYPVP